MSSTSVYLVFKTSAREVACFPNAHGSAPPVWGWLLEEILHKEKGSWLFGDNKELWPLDKDDRVPECIRMAHRFTFDGAVCPCNDSKALSLLLAEAGDIIKTKYPEDSNHWHGISRTLEVTALDKRAYGFALGCMSANDPWEYYPNADIKPWDMFTQEYL